MGLTMLVWVEGAPCMAPGYAATVFETLYSFPASLHEPLPRLLPCLNSMEAVCDNLNH